MAPVSISQNEILDAIREAAKTIDTGPEDAFTVREVVEASGRCMGVVSRDIRRLLASGAIENVRAVRVQINGVPRMISAFRLVKKPGRGRRG